MSHLMLRATSYGVVSHAVPSTTLPSGRVTLMAVRGIDATFSLYSAWRRSNITPLSLIYSGHGFSYMREREREYRYGELTTQFQSKLQLWINRSIQWLRVGRWGKAFFINRNKKEVGVPLSEMHLSCHRLSFHHHPSFRRSSSCFTSWLLL